MKLLFSSKNFHLALLFILGIFFLFFPIQKSFSAVSILKQDCIDDGWGASVRISSNNECRQQDTNNNYFYSTAGSTTLDPDSCLDSSGLNISSDYIVNDIATGCVPRVEYCDIPAGYSISGSFQTPENGDGSYIQVGKYEQLQYGSTTTYKLYGCDTNQGIAYNACTGNGYNGFSPISSKCWKELPVGEYFYSNANTPTLDQNSCSTANYTVTDINIGCVLQNSPPTISPQTFTPDENQTSVGTITASDADNDTLAYTILSGTDSSFFSIDQSTGELTFTIAPDYENPQNGGGDNSYELTVEVSDQNGGSDSATITVQVQDVNENPTANDDDFSENPISLTAVTK